MSTKILGAIATIALVLALSGGSGAVAQQTEKLPEFAPLLPEVRAKTNTVDPQKGYLLQQLKPDVFMITDGGYESVFVTTGQGVVLFDAPPSFARHIVQAVNEVTKEPIVELVYSHLHVDHIGGAGIVARQVPKPVSARRRFRSIGQRSWKTSMFGLKATAGPPWSMQSGMSVRARRANSLPSDLPPNLCRRSRAVSRLLRPAIPNAER